MIFLPFVSPVVRGLVLVLVMSFLPLPGFAGEPTPVIAVVELRMEGVPPGKNGQYQAGLEKLFRDRGSFAVIGADDIRNLVGSLVYIAPSDASARTQEISEMLDSGAALLVSDVENGISALEKAREAIHALRDVYVESDEDRQRHLLGEMLLARSLLESSREEDARNLLKSIILEYGEDLEVTRSRFHPHLVSAYQEVWDGNGEAARGMLVLPPESGVTALRLNGRAVESDVDGTLKGLLAGHYRVQVVKGDRRSAIHSIEITSGGSTHLPLEWIGSADLVSTENGLALVAPRGKAPAKTSIGLAMNVGKALKADFVAMIGVLPWKDGHRMFSVLVDIGEEKKAWSKSWVVSPNAFASDRLVHVANHIASGWGVVHAAGFGPAHWYNSVAGWSLTALGIGGIVTSAVYGVRYSDKVDELNERAKKPGFSPKQAEILQSEGQDLGTVSLISGLVGGVAIGTGVLLFLFEEWRDEPSSASAPTPFIWGSILPSSDGAAGFGVSIQSRF